MIDTIILSIPVTKRNIIDHSYFQPKTTNFFEYGSGYNKAVNNPTRQEQRCEYKPKVTLYRRFSPIAGVSYWIRIEFSASKVIYNNNLDEVNEKEFEKIVDNLKNKLRSRGVNIAKSDLSKAKVIAFHPSKNIELSGCNTVTMVLRDLAKVNLDRRMDLSNKHYQNGGHTLQYYTNSHALVFYDKVADMGKYSKRAVDKETTALQKSLFHSIRELRNYTDIEIMKMEVRLVEKRKSNLMLRELGFKENPNFKEVFNKGLCQKVLQYYWQNMVLERNRFIFQHERKNKQEEVFDFLMWARKNRKKPMHAIKVWALKSFCQSEGIPVLRQMIEEVFEKKSWASVAKAIKEIDEVANDGYEKFRKEYTVDIERALSEFEPLKKEQFNNPYGLISADDKPFAL